MKKLNKIIAVLFVLCIAFQNIAFAEPAPSDESIKIDTLTDDNTGVPELTAETAILGVISRFAGHLDFTVLRLIQIT